MSTITRRQFLGTAGLTVAGGLLIPRYTVSGPREVKSVFMHNIHTGEFLKTTYCENGCYVPEALAEVNKFFRDRITNEVQEIDPNLLDLIHQVYEKTGSSKPIELVSGYRCPKTNAALRNKSSGVAKKSYHMRGMAADLYIPGVKLADVRKAACSLGAGGVGYYPRSRFVHMDVRTGPKKRW